MEAVFRSVLNMSVTASFVMLAVLLLRWLLRRAPKKYSYLLWSVVGFRLACPVSFRSAFSLFNLGLFSVKSSQGALSYVPPYMGAGADYNLLLNDMKAPEPISTGIAVLDPAVQDAVPVSMKYSLDWFTVLSWLWCLGMALMLLYALVSYIRLRRSLRKAVRGEGNVWYAENLCSPFILGLVKPRIYLPFGLEEASESYVLSHERCHLRRGDHWVKPLAFLLLTLHWFNPLCHLAFYLMGLDMEMSCDERVLREHEGISKPYSTTLLSFAANRRFPLPSPLAFAESGAGKRIKHVLRWQRPKRWLSVLALVLCLALVIGCAADPREEAVSETLDISDITRAVITLKPTGDGDEPTVTIEGSNPLLRELETLLQAVVLGEKGKNYGEQTVAFDLCLSDGSVRNIAVSSPGIAIDGVTYEADEAACNALTNWAEDFFQPLPEKGTPPEEDNTLGKPYEDEGGTWVPEHMAEDVVNVLGDYYARLYAVNNPLSEAVEQALENDLAYATEHSYHAVSYVILDTVETVATPKAGSDEPCRTVAVDVLAAVMHANFDLRFSGAKKTSGSCDTAVLRFAVEEDGSYVFHEYLQQQAADEVLDIDSYFSTPVPRAWWEDEKLYLALMQDCYDQMIRYEGEDLTAYYDQWFKEMALNPSGFSEAEECLHGYEEIRQQFLFFGNHTLKYIYERFLAGGETGLEGQLMRIIMDDLLGEDALQLEAENGQIYFDALLRSARAMEAESGEDGMMGHPKLWLLLRMAESF